ncbi:glycoside hydrolase [Paenibacillus sp. P26]|nr:glycoside hydrolase [Paenibacillus sp. P26]
MQQGQSLFMSGQDGYHTFRIPTILVTMRGTVLAFARRGGMERETPVTLTSCCGAASITGRRGSPSG